MNGFRMNWSPVKQIENGNENRKVLVFFFFLLLSFSLLFDGRLKLISTFLCFYGLIDGKICGLFD